MKKLIAFGILLLLMSCVEKPDYNYISGSNFYGVSDIGINYFKDTRTGLCFAERGVGSSAYTFTCVPCDSVTHLIKNP